MVPPTDVPSADVLIVTATKIESKAVLDIFAEMTGQPARIVTKNRRTYRDLGAVGDTRVFLALTEMGSGGLGASQQTVQKGIEALRPGAVLLVGIAFGVDEKKQRIGDILVSQQLQLYDLQRIGKDPIVLRGDKPHASPRLINYFRQADLDWNDAKVEFGLILSGEKLVDHLDYREQLKQFGPEALGGEMEGAGLYVACQDAQVDWIVVKAICDWADGYKKRNKTARQRLAAGNAAAFVAHALQQAPLKRPESSVETATSIQNTGPGAVSVAGGVAAGLSGVAVGGDVHGDIHVHSAPATETFSPALHDAYLRRVMERCGTLSLTGIDPAATGQRETDPQLRLNAVYTALLTRSPRQEEVGDLEPRASKKRAEEEPLCSALEQLDRQQRLVLQGDPGSGKSTFVNFVALCLAGEGLKDDQANLRYLTAPLPDEEGKDGKKRQPWQHGALLPVPVVLRDFAATGLPERGEATAETLWNFVAQELKAACQAECVDWLRHELRERGGLLLLDGLDEVPEAERRREQVKRVVEAFAQSFGNCRILVTSRTYAYQNQGWRLQGFDEATLAPFSDGQIRRFVANWYAHTAGSGRLKQEDAAGRAELLRRAIFARPTLHELAQRPLLLTLMASLHAWRGRDLPEKREALYAETVDLLLNRWEQGEKIKYKTKGEHRLIQPSLAEYLKTDKDQVRAVLEALAFEAHRAQPDLTGTADIAEKDLAYRLFDLRNNPDANPKRLVEYLRDRAGLLYPRGIGVYAFPHRSFQEYLAACHLTDEDYPEHIAELTRAEPNRWREVALLAGAKAARGTAAGLWQLVDALCFRESADLAVEPADAWGAQIAAQALIETANLAKVGPANQRKLARVQQWLVKLMRDEHLPVTERALAGDNLAALGDPRFDAGHWHLPDEPLFGFIEIPAGPFKMGSDKRHDGQAYDDELPQHEVNLPGYYLARWPVTLAQFAAFVGASGHKPANPNCLKGIANHPVVWVDWNEAMAYGRWLREQLREVARERLDTEKALSESARWFWQGLTDGSLGVGLPSEAEWEKAARGADGRIYPWGNEPDPHRANYDETGLGATSAVGCFSGGASPCGCEEMSGNVWEWTRTLSVLNSFPFGDGVVALNHGLPNYPYPLEGSERQAQEDLSAFTSRVLRGGAFSRSSRVVRCAKRIVSSSDHGSDNFGFRVVVSPLVFSDR
jgi:formylglycine-generating enzyme required for sulfatase activity/nucleoside phosphorylase